MTSKKIIINQVPKEVKILTIDEVVELTGYSKKYIYKLTSLGKIPHSKTPTGRRLFFNKAHILKWMQSAQFGK